MDSTTYTRAGITVLSNDGSDGVSAYRTSLRNLAAWANANGAMYAQGLLSARPAAGKAGRFYRATDDATGIVYYDDGTAWQAIGTTAATDAAAGVGSLRTLGAGSLQAAAGNHTHGGTAVYAYVSKASDTTGSTVGTTPAADPDLKVTLGTGTYQVTALLSIAGSTGRDFTGNWTFGGTATVPFRGIFGPGYDTSAVLNSPSIAAYVDPALANQSSIGLVSGSNSFCREDLILVVTASGLLTFQWSQNVATSGAATVLKAGSALSVQKLV